MILFGKLKTRIQNAFRLNAPKVSHVAQEHDELVERAFEVDLVYFWTRFCACCFHFLPFLQQNDGSDSSDNLN
ncbi:MAG: hypothetical protein SFY67_07840 [Candidatus Melainabacteria bacterium]|nr:hypothetical protein [Candidatus Melainabacteria bacterium]